MSTEAQPGTLRLRPESPPTTRKSSLFQKLKQKPPTAFEKQASLRRAHQRSSSLGAFVQRILPSHREDIGYTLRQQYEDNGTQDPVDLIFGVTGPQGSDGRASLDAHREDSAKKTRSRSPRKSDARPAMERSRDRERIPDGPCVGLEGQSSEMEFDIGTAIQAPPRARATTSTWGKGLGAINRKEIRGERDNLHQDAQDEAEANISLLSIDIPELEYSEMTKTQRMYEDKKVRRQQRRSLRESGDFLGVQGANPRTGYWDISSGTSSTGPSQLSEETTKKFDEEARDIEEKKRKYEEAQAKHQAELTRVKSLRDSKKKEREMRKKLEQKLKQRRHGKWRLNEGGWSSVAEPELSPIVQSVVGSPTRETAYADRLFPMPSAADPNPYVNAYNIGPHDYFGHRQVSSPLARERSGAASVFRNSSIPRKPVGSPVRQQHNQSSDTIIHTSRVAYPGRNDQLEGLSQEVSHPRDKDLMIQESLDTQLLENLYDSFLESIPLPVEPGDPRETEATATSFQSFSMSQVETLHMSEQTPKVTSSETRYNSLKELPPVNLKDPFTARLPLSSHPVTPIMIWAPPTTPASPERQGSHITTPTTITTGYAQLQPLLIQSDGPSNDTQVKHQFVQRKTSQIPLRASSHQNSKRHILQSTGCQTIQADIATSSEHLLTQTKQRTIRLCHTMSPGGERVVMKGTPTSMSTSPQTPHQLGKVSPAAHTAAFTAFQSFRHRAAMKEAVGQERENSLTPPKARRPEKETRDSSPRAKPAVLGGQGDIGSPSRVEREPDLYNKRLSAAVRAGGSWGSTRDDSLVVWHPEPNEENKKSKVVTGPGEVMELACLPRKGAASPAKKPMVEERSEIMSLIKTYHNRAISPIRVGSPQRAIRGSSGVTAGHQQPPKPEDYQFVKYAGGQKEGGPSSGERASPKSATPQRHSPSPSLHGGTSGIALRIIITAWWFVEPVFDPESDLRKRWERGGSSNKLTRNDMGLFVAAVVILGVILLILIMGFKALLLAMQMMRAIGGVFRVVAGF